MKTTFVWLTIFFAIALTGCGDKTLPKPNNAKTAGFEALVSYGVAAHAANQYLALPQCTSPVTAVPCKTQALAESIKKAENAAFAAALAADTAANDPAKQQDAVDKIDALRKQNGQASNESNGSIKQ